MIEALRQSQIVAKTLKFFAQLFAAFAWIWFKLVVPISRPFRAVGSRLFHWYRRLWEAKVYRKDGSFSWARSGMLLTATLAFLYVIPQVLLFTFDATLYAVTGRTETVYLTSSQEIYPDDDIHAVKGCYILPCSEQTSIYYRVRPRLFHHVWSFFDQGTLFYPDFIAAAIPPGISECETVSYGIRVKFLMRRADIYPDLLGARCRPVRG